jgi:hypothetical protein
VTSKHELKERIMAGIKDINRHPVIHTWSYKLAEAARYDSNHGNAELGRGPSDRSGMSTSSGFPIANKGRFRRFPTCVKKPPSDPPTNTKC